MFEYLSTYHYGRCVKDENDWYVKSIGVNRIYYLNEGNVTVKADGKPYTLKPGMLYLFPQNLKFEVVLAEGTYADHTFFDFFTIPAICMQTPIMIDPAKTPFVESAVKLLFELALAHPTYPSTERNEYTNLVESCLSNLLQLIDRKQRLSIISDPRINSALEYIHRNFNKDISLEELTRITNLEKNYLIRLFKQYINASPYQYILKYRMNVALSMIKRRYPLSDVALQVGYSDVASFSHAFKRIYGISPSAIRPPR